MFEKWAGTTRYVYNRILNRVKLDPNIKSNVLTKEYITAKDNNIITNNDEKRYDKFIYDWELETPKDIRKGALRDIEKARKTCKSNLRTGNISSYDLGPRLKKKGKEQSLEIPNDAIKVIRYKNQFKGLKIYTRYSDELIKVPKKYKKDFKNIKELEHYCRLKKENNNWYLCIPFKAFSTSITNDNKTCALDPGVRKFQVIYSEDKLVEIKTNKERLYKYYTKLDKLKSLRDKKLINSNKFKKKYYKISTKLTNLIDELHYKTIKYLTTSYNNILLPSFETQDMIQGNRLRKSVKRNMNLFKFYKFKTRLEDKCLLTENCNVKIVSEAYTSCTCGFCGYMNKTSSEIITCNDCFKKYDRDTNGSRNIYIRNTD